MTSDTPEALGDGELTAEMLTPFGSPRYLRTRNFATLETGTDCKIWMNWICDNDQNRGTLCQGPGAGGQTTPSPLAKALRNELVPQNPNDEPAEKFSENTPRFIAGFSRKN